MATTKEWWRTFWEDYYPIFQLFSKSTSELEARKIAKLLGLKKGDSLLDCPCGTGRIALAMAAKGIKVTGVDLTRDYLKEASAKASRKKLKIELHCTDMRKIHFNNRFDAAVNLFTSFGYFEKETDNVLVLRKLYNALKPGGRVLVSTKNRDWVVLNFRPDNWFEVGNVTVLQKRKIDYATSVIHDEWRFLKDGAERVHYTMLRHYSYHELLAMFKKVGFEDIEGYGSLEGAATERTNSMLHVVGVKPKSKRK